jgi:hypothetical protein
MRNCNHSGYGRDTIPRLIAGAARAGEACDHCPSKEKAGLAAGFLVD